MMATSNTGPLEPFDTANIRSMLRDAGLRPTRQRVSLAELLFAKGHRHISAEGLHEEAMAHRVPVSLATVYNTLHQFTEAGLLREVVIDGSKTYFDTNISDHHHFYIEDEDKVVDIPSGRIAIDHLPEPLPGTKIDRVEIVIRLRQSGK